MEYVDTAWRRWWRLLRGWVADADDAEGDGVVVEGVGEELEIVGDGGAGAGRVSVGDVEGAVVSGLEGGTGLAGLSANAGWGAKGEG